MSSLGVYNCLVLCSFFSAVFPIYIRVKVEVNPSKLLNVLGSVPYCQISFSAKLSLPDFKLGAMSNTTTPPINSECPSLRNVGDIVWSCVMTIFACTWVAVHPNIPAISDTDIVIALRRTGLMVCGFIAPEIIILWAMKQWHGAREIGQRYKGMWVFVEVYDNMPYPYLLRTRLDHNPWILPADGRVYAVYGG